MCGRKRARQALDATSWRVRDAEKKVSTACCCEAPRAIGLNESEVGTQTTTTKRVAEFRK
jgi:hypothetical protein